MEGLIREVAFESKGQKVNLRKTKVVVSRAEGELSVSNVSSYLCICGKQVMANSVLCVKCIMHC